MKFNSIINLYNNNSINKIYSICDIENKKYLLNFLKNKDFNYFKKYDIEILNSYIDTIIIHLSIHKYNINKHNIKKILFKYVLKSNMLDENIYIKLYNFILNKNLINDVIHYKKLNYI